MCGAYKPVVVASTGLVDPMWARNKRQLYKDTPQWSRVTVKTNFEIKQDMNGIKTDGDDIHYLITPRNLEIHLVIGLCCFEVCFGMGLLTGLQWYSSPY